LRTAKQKSAVSLHDFHVSELAFRTTKSKSWRIGEINRRGPARYRSRY